MSYVITRRFMEFRAKHVGELGAWTVGQLQSARQQDGSSCGAFVLLVRISFVVLIMKTGLNSGCENNLRPKSS